MNEKRNIQVEEVLVQQAGQVTEVEYIFTENLPDTGTSIYRVRIKRHDYEQFAAQLIIPTLPFDKFITVTRVLMMHNVSSEDIAEAFHLLDRDNSGTIDSGELAIFMPVIVPNINPYMLLYYIEKVDENNDYQLNIEEFIAFIRKGIGRDLALGRF